MTPAPTTLVSIIIPHYLGDVVLRCLASVFEHTTGDPFEIIIADDQPRDDGSIRQAMERWPEVRVVTVGGGRGFGAAVNAGIRAARAPLLFLLNNDAQVGEGWLPPLLDAAARHPEAGAFQAKVRSLKDRARFDYGGGAGGLIDRLGYPFALGRLFDKVEVDHGQHDEPREIFWAMGGAMLLRRSALDVVGPFDEAFYMHMEEIDLCWRLHAAGFTVRSVPAAVVWHEGGHSLAQESFKKAWLNHRNALVLLLKNWTAQEILLLLPARVAFELGTMIYGLVRRDWKHPTAALLALLWVLTHPVAILRRRAQAQEVRRVSARDVARRVYPGSVAWQRFVRGATTVAELPGFVTTPALGVEDAGRLTPVQGNQPQQPATEHVNAGAAQTREAEAGAR